MTRDEQRVRLEKQVEELANSAFELGGAAYLEELEGFFYRQAQAIRERKKPETHANESQRTQAHWEKYGEIIGRSPAMIQIFHTLDKVAPSMVPVLIQGASGTGKELIARAIHQNSPRKEAAFVAENCAAIPETLLESELFGYERGAFTGADKSKKGLFVVADGGTLFLDEIGEMSLNMQKKLLRVLQNGEIRPVGGNSLIHVEVRLLSASNRNLKEMVKQHHFREDLYFRLNTITLELPLLKDRLEDIEDLAVFFMKKIAGEMNRSPLPFSPAAKEAMKHYSWPGNIRELENEIRRCLALVGEVKEIALNDLSEGIVDSL